MLSIGTQGRPVERRGAAGKPVPARLGLAGALLSIAKSTRALHGLKLAVLGLNNGQDELLIAIPDGGAAVNEMAEALMVRPSTVSKMMDHLIAKGLIERMGDPKDRRRTIVRILPAGIEARQRVIEARAELDDDLVRPLDAATRAALEARLRDCSDRLAKRLRRLR